MVSRPSTIVLASRRGTKMPKEPLGIKALKDNLILLPLVKKMSKGGIDISAEKAKDPYRKGVVLAKGPGLNVENDNGNSIIPEWLKEGDIVLFHTHAGWDIEFDGKKYVNVSWRNVECMVNPEYVEWSKEQEKEK